MYGKYTVWYTANDGTFVYDHTFVHTYLFRLKSLVKMSEEKIEKLLVLI